MNIIPFKSKEKPAAPVVAESSRLKPNFEDPHSKDFFDEPRYNKAAERISLNQSELQALQRLRENQSLTATFHPESIELTTAIDAQESGITMLNGQTTLSLPVATIFKDESDPAALTYSYELAQAKGSGSSTSLLHLFVQLERHIETGSPDLPEPDIWR